MIPCVYIARMISFTNLPYETHIPRHAVVAFASMVNIDIRMWTVNRMLCEWPMQLIDLALLAAAKSGEDIV